MVRGASPAHYIRANEYIGLLDDGQCAHLLYKLWSVEKATVVKVWRKIIEEKLIIKYIVQNKKY